MTVRMILPELVPRRMQARRSFRDFPWVMAISVLTIRMRMTGNEENSGVIFLTFTA
jgi:hypothetical protein